MEEKEGIHFETLSINDTVSGLKTDASNGLSEDEAKKRLEKFGPNELKEKKKKNVLQIFLSQLNDPMIFVLFAAIGVTIVVSIFETIEAGYFDFLNVGDWPDVIIILAVIIINAVIGTVQEVKAQTSLDALKKMSSPETTVIREGKRYRIKAKDLVPGDLVIIEEGDTIGADIRLIEAINLKCTESSLTGESVPVEKKADIVFSEDVSIGDKANMAFMSTVVAYGRGRGIVSSTGMKTEIGKIATSLDNEVDDETPLQKVLAKLSKVLGLITLGIVLVVLLVEFIWIFIHGNQTVVSEWISACLSAISLAVAAVPEGLAAVVTIVLSIGVSRMVKANTIVRKLPSVETLGAVSVVCSDKTGTLTQNKMTVLEAYTNMSNYTNESFTESNLDEGIRLLAKGMSLCSNATVDEGLYGDPTEIALVDFSNKFGMHKKDLEEKEPRVKEYPFDSVRKMMSTMHDYDGDHIVYTKGAMDQILKHTTKIYIDGSIRDITEEDILKINEQNKYYSSKALRTLALAISYQDELNEDDLIFVGLVAMIDPERPEALPAVLKFKEAGITTVMITGDHKDTAYQIAKNLNIVENIEDCLTGADVDEMSFDELKEACKTTRVFARVSPENKVQIVKAFKANGNICAMTGDGVNDAPSLKAADIGIAMGITGTDVAKGAADMVLTDDNFASIEKAVEEGRGIYANIKKTVLFLLSSNIAEVLAMLILIIIGLPAPLIAIHLLWVNLITDSLPAIALGMDPKAKGIMKDKPRNPNEGLFAHGGILITVGYGLAITIAVVIAYFYGAWSHGIYNFNDIFNLFNLTKDATYQIGDKVFTYSMAQEVLHESRTMAFTTLAFAELFHMLGMSNVKESFIHIFKDKNYMMYLAFFLGIGLQFFVILVPGVNQVFNTRADLSIDEWLMLALFSLSPLIIHEIAVIIIKIKNRKKK